MTAASPNREITLEDALAQLTDSDRSELQVLLGEKLEELRDDGIATAFSNWTTPTILAGALTAILFPLGGVGGLMGVFGMFGLSIGLPMIGVWQAFQTSGKILEGDTSLLVETLGKEKVLAAQKDAIETKLEYAKKRLPPDTHVKGANPAAANPMNPNQPASKSGTNQWVDTSPQPESAAPAQASGSPQEGSGDGTSESKSGLLIKPVELDSAAPHLFMVGRTREGKSETLKHLIGREKRVWYLTSKATDKVPEHWTGYRVGGPDLGKQITWLLDQWEDSFLRHLELVDSNREWFVIDEAVGILQSLKTKKAKDVAERLRGFIVEVITAGAAVGAFAGILSQTGNAGPIGVDEDLLKNFSIVGCGKRKKAQMLKAFLKLTDLKVTSDEEKDILMRDGYWQLWENNGVCLSQVPLSNLKLKEVERCPVDESEIESSDIEGEEETLEARILRHLRKHGEARTVREIRNAVTNNRDKERASTDEIKIILQQLINLEKVRRWADGSSDRYQATGTV